MHHFRLIISLLFAALSVYPMAAVGGLIHRSSSGVPIFGQGMGATTPNGFVAAFPLSPSALTPSLVPDGNATISAGTAVLNIAASFASNFSIGQTIFAKTGGTRYGKIIGSQANGATCGAGACTGTNGVGTYLLDTVSAGGIATTEVIASPGARQFFVDSVHGNNITCNGLSPYSGFQMNGSGPNFQSGATGQGASSAAYCPFETFTQAFYQTVANIQYQTGNQIFLAEGQSFGEGGAIFTATFAGTTMTVSSPVTSGFIEGGLWPSFAGVTGTPQIIAQLTSTEAGSARGGRGTYQISTTQTATGVAVSGWTSANNFGAALNFRYGESVAYPFTIQSYNLADPLNAAKQGMAIGSNRPAFTCDPIPTTFTGTVTSNGTSSTLTIDSGTIVGDGVSVGKYLTVTGGGSAITNTFVIAGSGLVWTLNVPQAISDQSMTLGGIGQICKILSHSRSDNPQASGAVEGNWAIRGLHFQSAFTANNGLTLGGNIYNYLAENNVMSNFGLAAGPSPASNQGFNNSQNIILRHNSVGQNWVNGTSPGGSGIGTGFVDGLVVEDNVMNQGGWLASAANVSAGGTGRQEATFPGSVAAGVLTVTGSVIGTIAIGQRISTGNQPYIISGSGASWNLSNSLDTFTGSLTSFNFNGATIFDHCHYAAHGSDDQSLNRRNVYVNCSAAGLSGRGSMIAYNNVFIDNPVQALAGGASNSPAATIANFTGGISGTLLTVTAVATAPIWNTSCPSPNAAPGSCNSVIYPSQSTFVTCASSCISGQPKVLSQVTPLLGGETLGGVGRYNLSSSQTVAPGTPLATSTGNTGYMGESPGGVVWNYSDSLVMGGNNISDTQIRYQGVSLNDGLLGSNVVRFLAVNSQLYGNTGTWVFQNTAAQDWSSNADYSGNISYNVSPSFECSAANCPQAFQAQVLSTFGNGTSTPPGLNNVNAWAITSGSSYNDATGVVTLTLTSPVTFASGAIITIGQLTGAANISKVNSQIGTSSVASGTSVTFQATSGLIGNSIANAITGGSMSYSPHSNQDLYAALGFGSRDAMAVSMAANPDQPWAYPLLKAAGSLFNFQFTLH